MWLKLVPWSKRGLRLRVGLHDDKTDSLTLSTSWGRHMKETVSREKRERVSPFSQTVLTASTLLLFILLRGASSVGNIVLVLLSHGWERSVQALISLGVLVLANSAFSQLTYHFHCLFVKGLPMAAVCNACISFQIGAVCSPHLRVRPLKNTSAAARLAWSSWHWPLAESQGGEKEEEEPEA